MKRCKPISLPAGRRGLARLYGPKLVIVWDGGIAEKNGAQADLEALPEVVDATYLNAQGFTVTERKANEP
jgi:hypothetical protein